MDDTRAWRHNLEVVEGLRAPLEELESLAVTLELELFVLLGGAGDTSSIDLNGVIDDEVDGAEWVDLAWVTSETLHGVTHSCQIDNSWYSTKIFKNSRVSNEQLNTKIKFKSRVKCTSKIVIIS